MTNSSQYVVCVDNSDYLTSLEVRKIYQVLPVASADKRAQLRVIDESGEDYLYPSSRFLRITLPQEIVAAITKAA